MSDVSAGETRALRLLVADDEESMRYYLRRGLERHGHDVTVVEDGAAAVDRYAERPFDAVVADLKMPQLDGIEVLREVRRLDPEACVLLMTAFATVRSAVEAMRDGAADYVTKPFEIDELLLVLDRALDHRATKRENRELRRLVDRRSGHAGLVGQSPAMRAVYEAIDLVRGSDATVLIHGESGTGKELVARAIHVESARSKGPFVPLHCAALSDTLVENELFGHEAGAFTGAAGAKRGLLAKADGGTLFLDEVSEISPPVQTKLERFLQEREFLPLGAERPLRVDVRIIAATNRDLERETKQGTFRAELFWRLSVVPIHLPALRERREDVLVLVNHFLAKSRRGGARPGEEPDVSLDATVALTNYDWPGNVRELQNLVERVAVLHGDARSIELEHLPDHVQGCVGDAPPPSGAVAATSYADALERFEREYLMGLLRRTEGNVTEAARIAGLSRGHLHRKSKQLGVEPEEYRGETEDSGGGGGGGNP